MEPAEGADSSPRTKPFALWVIAGGLLFAAAVTLVLGVQSYAANGSIGEFLSTLIFAALLLVPVVFTWREKRWAYLAAAIVSLVLLILYLSFSASSLSNPADNAFAALAVLAPTLLLVAGFGIQAFRHAKTDFLQKKYLASVQSAGGLVTLAVVGFVIGMLVAGTIGAGVILRNTTGAAADIKIVANAMNAAVPYSPATFTVAVGRTVTWINLDTTAHTVTSNVTGQFDSGSITTGQSWSRTFTQAGTYHYFCSFHPQMTGTIIVQ